jgi:hypothetical protein
MREAQLVLFQKVMNEARDSRLVTNRNSAAYDAESECFGAI